MADNGTQTNKLPPEKTGLYSTTASLPPNSFHDQYVYQEISMSDPGSKPTLDFRDRLKGWRLSVFLGLLITIFVLIVNIAILAWTYSSLVIKSGSAIAWAGTSNNLKNVSTWMHLGVNILSSLLLAASNNAMQCLVAPTRREVEKAHASGKWIQIGIPGMHNLSKIAPSRAIVWALLLLSSLPIHLLYVLRHFWRKGFTSCKGFC
jgi:hypothetical protein